VYDLDQEKVLTMSADMYAFAECSDGKNWKLCYPLVKDDRDSDWETKPLVDELIPRNISPGWGQQHTYWYSEVSGFRGIPDDVDPHLRNYVEEHWTENLYGDELVAPSWLTLTEIDELYDRDIEAINLHFSDSMFARPKNIPNSLIRVVFWRDQ
jgi:hypothetical protein